MKIFGKEFGKSKNSINKSQNATSVSLADLSFLQMLGLDTSNIINPKNIGEITYYTCLRTLSDKVSSIPVGVYSSPDGISSKPENHYLNYILQTRPNVFVNAPIFWSGVERDRNDLGNAFVFISTNPKGRYAGRINSLWHLPADEVQIFIDDAGIFDATNSLWYIWSDSRTGKQYKISHTQVLHLKTWLTEKDGIIGKPVKNILNSYIDTSQESSYYVNKLVKNGMVTDKILLQYTGDLDEKAKTALVGKLETYSKSNSGKFLPIPAGLEAKNLSSKLVDSQFEQLSKYNSLSIAAAFGIPPSYLNNLDKANFANVEVLQDGLYRDTLLPILTQYETEMECKLLTQAERDNGFYFYYNVDVILRTSLEKRAEAYSKMISTAVLTPNEARSKENLPPKEGGDELIIQGGNTTLTNVVKGINFGNGGANK